MGPPSEALLWVPLGLGVLAVVTFAGGQRASGLSALLAAVSWPGLLLVASSAPMYAIGQLTAPLWAPALLSLALMASRISAARATARGPSRWAVAALLAVAVGAGWLRAFTYEPFSDPSCHQWCVANPIVVSSHPANARLLVLLGAAAFLSAWVVIVVRAVRGRLFRTGAVGPVTVVLAGLAVVAIGEQVTWVALGGSGHPEAPPTVARWMHLCAGVAAALLLLALFADRLGVARRIRSVAGALSLGPGGVAAALADALRDPGLVIAHRIEGNGLIEASGRTLGPRATGRSRTELVEEGEVIAVIDHRSSVPGSVLARHLGTAMRTAVQNEGLEVGLTHRVAELAESRRRLVAASDAARTRLERDLHDGAQHGVLALSIELGRLQRAAHTEAGGGGAQQIEHQASKGLALAAVVAERLRDVARGIHPAVLEAGGLSPALQQLADTSPTPFILSVDDLGRLPPEVERAAYAIARDATASAIDAMQVRHDGALMLKVRSQCPVPQSAVDRAATLGGVVTQNHDGWEVRLPCG